MPRSSSAGHSDRTSLYQEITSRIIAELEAGRLPWVQPWGTSAVQADVLARIADHPASRLHELLPWNWRPTQMQRAA